MEQCDQIGRNFAFWATFLHFWLNKQLQNTVCSTYFNNQKELGVVVLDFQFELEYFGYSLGYISKYWANFCSIFWSLWPEETCPGTRAIILYPSLIFPGQAGSSTRVSSSLECIDKHSSLVKYETNIGL